MNVWHLLRISYFIQYQIERLLAGHGYEDIGFTQSRLFWSNLLFYFICELTVYSVYYCFLFFHIVSNRWSQRGYIDGELTWYFMYLRSFARWSEISRPRLYARFLVKKRHILYWSGELISDNNDRALESKVKSRISLIREFTLIALVALYIAIDQVRNLNFKWECSFVGNPLSMLFLWNRSYRYW